MWRRRAFLFNKKFRWSALEKLEIHNESRVTMFLKYVEWSLCMWTVFKWRNFPSSRLLCWHYFTIWALYKRFAPALSDRVFPMWYLIRHSTPFTVGSLSIEFKSHLDWMLKTESGQFETVFVKSFQVNIINKKIRDKKLVHGIICLVQNNFIICLM